MHKDLDSIVDLLRIKQKQVDDIEWENPSDPRIEGLLSQIRDYKDKINRGELYEPRF